MYKVGTKVMITNKELYPDNSYLMGVVSAIYDSGEASNNISYDIHFGISGIPDAKNVIDKDLIPY